MQFRLNPGNGLFEDIRACQNNSNWQQAIRASGNLVCSLRCILHTCRSPNLVFSLVHSRRIALAEQEARTEFLRRKARGIEETPTASGSGALQATSQELLAAASKPSGHINFFQAEEDGEKFGQNEEYQAEKKEEKEKFEKNIGLLTYLGQSAVESQQSKPWWFKAPDRKRKQEGEEEENQVKKKHREEYDFKRKYDLDPMRHMTKYLDIKEKHENKKKAKDDSSKKHKKHKHKHDKERDDTKSGKKTIEQLRAERLKREKEERRRSEELLARARGEKLPTKEKEVVLDERERRYNSQFNPDFVRKPRSKRF